MLIDQNYDDVISISIKDRNFKSGRESKNVNFHSSYYEVELSRN